MFYCLIALLTISYFLISMSLKRIVFILLVATFILNVSAQESIRTIGDSIKKHIYSNPEKAITFCHKYIKLNEEANNVSNLSMAYAAMAIAQENKGDLDSIPYYYFKRSSLFNKPVDSIVNIYFIARIYDNNYKYNKALKSYRKLLELARKQKEGYSTDYIDFAIEIIKSKVESHKAVPENVIFSLEELYEDALKAKDSKRERFTRKKLIDAYLQSNKTDKALPLVEKGIAQAKAKNNLKFMYYMLSSRAKIHVVKNNKALAIADFEDALTCANTLKNITFIKQAKYELASIAYKQEDYNKTITYLKEIENSDSKATAFQLHKNYKLFAEAYKKIGAVELSNEYFSRHSIAKEVYFKDYFNIIDKIYEITLNENVQYLKKNHQSDLEKEILEKEGEKKTKWFWAGLSFILLIIIFAITVYLKKKTRENQKRFNELMVKVKTLEENKLNKANNALTSTKVKEGTAEGIKNSQYKLDSDKVKALLDKLQKLESTNYFLRKDCSLHTTAKKLKTNTSYLSKIVNTHLEKSFSTYINELRINYAIVELKNNKRLRAYSIKAIAEEIGYKNSDAFGRYFKAETGLTPSVYIKKIQNENL